MDMKVRADGMKKPEFRMLCNKCKTPQPLSSGSSENWAVYKTGEKCACGGEFVMFMDDEPLRKKQKEVSP